ncbi:MAG: hypothetical protein ACTSPB_12705 [Candidatus Thorarchaeota archaeon]
MKTFHQETTEHLNNALQEALKLEKEDEVDVDDLLYYIKEAIKSADANETCREEAQTKIDKIDKIITE